MINRLTDRFLLNFYIKSFAKRNAGRNSNSENTLCLFCQPGSGSTWLAEIVLQMQNTCLIDEPLWRGKLTLLNKFPEPHIRKIPQVAELGFYNFQPILEDEDWKEAESLFCNILSGRIPQLGLYREIELARLKTADTYIVKFNLAQLLMHWLIRRFNTSSILLLRHPCGVVSSQMRLPAFGSKSLSYDWSKLPKFRNSTVFSQYEYLYRSFSTIEQWLAFIWAVQVKHSLYHPDNNKKWLTVAYEKLVLDFQNEITRIFNYLGREIPENIADMHKRPSKSARPGSDKYIIQGQQIDSWKKKLTKEQINKIIKVVEDMEINLYSYSPEPDYDTLYKGHPKP